MRRLLAALLLPLLLLTGCWDRKEIEEQSTVLATSFDLCDEPGCRLLVGRQIAIPGRIPLGASEGATMAAPASPVSLLTVKAQDLPDSIQKVQAQLNYRVSLGHARIALISEDLARSGRMDALYVDTARRNPEARRMQWVAVTEGSAEAVLRARPEMERVPALFLNDLIADAVERGSLPAVSVGEFMTRISNAGEEAVAPMIAMQGPHPALAGLAVFRGTTMVGRLQPEEVSTYMQLRGNRRASELLQVPLASGEAVSLAVYGRTAEWHLHNRGGRLEAHVAIRLESSLFRAPPGVGMSDPASVADLERRAAETVTKNARRLIKKLQQEWQADILAVGERVRAYQPGAWAGIRAWPAAFARLPIQVTADVQIRRFGIMTGEGRAE